MCGFWAFAPANLIYDRTGTGGAWVDVDAPPGLPVLFCACCFRIAGRGRGR